VESGGESDCRDEMDECCQCDENIAHSLDGLISAAESGPLMQLRNQTRGNSRRVTFETVRTHIWQMRCRGEYA
jgi:hypothetical protein